MFKTLKYRYHLWNNDEMTYEMNHTVHVYEIKWSYDPHSCERNFCNFIKKHEKFSSSTGLEPVTSQYQCNALTNWAIKPRWSPEFFRLLCAIAKIAFITARIIASLDFISAVHILIHFMYHFIVDSLIHCSSREHWNPQMTSSQHQWLHSSVG